MFFGYLQGGVFEFFDFSGGLITSFFGVIECRGSTLLRNFGTFTVIRFIKPQKLIYHLLFSFIAGFYCYFFHSLFSYWFFFVSFLYSSQFLDISRIKTPRCFSVFIIRVPAKSEGSPWADGTHWEANIIPVERSLIWVSLIMPQAPTTTLKYFKVWYTWICLSKKYFLGFQFIIVVLLNSFVVVRLLIL